METVATAQSEPETEFDRILRDKEEYVSQTTTNTRRRTMERKFGSAYDDALRQKDEAGMTIINEKSKLDKANVQIILDAEAVIVRADATIEALRKHHKTLFGKDLPQE